jgi:hypothetical protein
MEKLKLRIIRFLHRHIRPCCTFDSANGFYHFQNCGHYYYSLRCRCGATRWFRDADDENNQLVDVLFKELGLAGVMGEVDRGL